MSTEIVILITVIVLVVGAIILSIIWNRNSGNNTFGIKIPGVEAEVTHKGDPKPTPYRTEVDNEGNKNEIGATGGSRVKSKGDNNKIQTS